MVEGGCCQASCHCWGHPTTLCFGSVEIKARQGTVTVAGWWGILGSPLGSCPINAAMPLLHPGHGTLIPFIPLGARRSGLH